jgi:uncharacterized repeat protein (TIGR03803 family)
VPIGKHPLCSRAASCCLLALVLCVRSYASTPVEKIIYQFQGPPDGASPNAALVADASGNLYGTTSAGGNGACSDGCGTVFELSPPAVAGAAWTETLLYSFEGGANDGATPLGTLMFDDVGNLYGTTNVGGPNNGGSVFELSPPATPDGAWTETVLCFFGAVLGIPDGYNPAGKLVMDPDGNLYGTTYYGGQSKNGGRGTVFELIRPPSGGAWKKRLLYTFGIHAGDGANPASDLLLRGGVLYGTTLNGGTGPYGGVGTVFQLVRKPGNWTETILHNFEAGADGAIPYGGLIADSEGNLYGTTFSNGMIAFCCSGGSIYELSPPATTGDPWQETILYTFPVKGGFHPSAGLWRDKLGDLFGTTTCTANISFGGGSVFKLKAPAAVGDWKLAPMHDFPNLFLDRQGDGYNPQGALILVNGVFYGTTLNGGSVSKFSGSVFSITP